MSQIFISHVEEDESIALEIAHGLEAAGYSTWYYERDSLPGVSYLDQIDEAIEHCQAVVVIISLASLSSWQVDKEVERAHESGKHFVPVLSGVKHIEFQTRKRGWRMAMGANTSISVPADGASSIVPRIVGGLRRLVINSEEPVPSSPVNGQTAAQDVSFSEPAGQSVENGEARLLQSEAVAAQPLLGITPTVGDVDVSSAQIESAEPRVVDVPNSSEPVAARTHRTIPGIPALLRRGKTRAALIVLAVLVFLVFAIYAYYGISRLRSREVVTNSDQAAQSKKVESGSSVAGTTWAGDGKEVFFNPNGIAQFKSSSGYVYDTSGHWVQNSSHVKFDVNNYTIWEVVISPGGNEMKGTSLYKGNGAVSSVQFTKVHERVTSGDLTGSIWWMRGGDEVAFKPNGVTAYKRLPQGPVNDSSGHWEQNGNHVKFDLSNNYTVFEVLLSPDGNEMKGTQRFAQNETVNSVSFEKKFN